MSGDEIERLHEPRGERPVPLRAEPDPTVARRPGRLRKVAREPAGDLGRHARPSSDAFGRKLADERREGIDILHAALETPQPHPSLREHLVQHGCEKQRIGPGPDGDMRIGDLCGLGASWIDNDHASAAIANGKESALHARAGHQAAVRHHRVRAEDEEVVGPLEIGDRNEGEMTEHAKRGEHLRELVGRARRIHVLRPERAREG